jgi:hypothetical protein
MMDVLVVRLGRGAPVANTPEDRPRGVGQGQAEQNDGAETEQRRLEGAENRQPGEPQPQRESAAVAHEDPRRVEVEPQEPDARPDKSGREDRHGGVLLVVAALDFASRDPH